MSAVGPTTPTLSDMARANKYEHLTQVSLTSAKMMADIAKSYNSKTGAEIFQEFGFGTDRRVEKYEGEFALRAIADWAKREMWTNEAKLAFTPPPNISAAATLEMANEAAEAAAEAPPLPNPSSKANEPDQLMACGWPPMRSSDYWADARERPVHPGDVSAMADILDHLMTTSGHFRRSWEGSLARAAKVLQDNCNPEQMAAWNWRNGIRTPKYSTHKDAPESMLPPPKRARTD